MTNSTGQVDFSLWLLRLIAYLIDTLIIGIVVGIIISLISTAAVLSGTYSYFWFGSAYYAFTFPLIIGIIEVAYFVILEVWIGGTAGKKILGFEVQMENSQKITAYKSLIRNISKIYWPFLVIDWLLAVLIPGPDKRQKYSDRFATTTVIQLKQPFASPPPSSQLQ